MNNFSINYDFNPSDSTAMDEFRNNSLKEQKMEVSKDFTPMLVLVPNKELDFFTKMLQKFNFKIDKSDERLQVATNNDTFEISEDKISKRLKTFHEVVGAFDDITATDEEIKSVVGLSRIRK